MTLQSECRGGWCRKRDSCALYGPRSDSIVVDRLCEPGGTDAFTPINEHRAKLFADPKFAAWVAGQPESRARADHPPSPQDET